MPRRDGERIGVVTGLAMAPLMKPLLEKLTAACGATFELLVAENSLFGPTITTAGLLVGKDILRALGDRHDLDIALIPAETINEDRIFLDDRTFEDVREALPMPVFPSYDFIDVLTAKTTGVAA
jgi:NifB/MoaA-like Fe-S oxidoreductase